ncbi:MAG: hypothetical protein U0792_03820 [Gemmataceae bacterium]
MVVVDVEELLGPMLAKNGSDDDDMLVTFNEDGCNSVECFKKLWAMLILMAIRDKASSLHYHPWRKDGVLAYVVENTRYEMVPPPAKLAQACFEVARLMFMPPDQQQFWERSAEHAACSAVRMEFEGWASLWDAVCWSSGERVGVDLFLVAQFA